MSNIHSLIVSLETNFFNKSELEHQSLASHTLTTISVVGREYILFRLLPTAVHVRLYTKRFCSEDFLVDWRLRFLSRFILSSSSLTSCSSIFGLAMFLENFNGAVSCLFREGVDVVVRLSNSLMEPLLEECAPLLSFYSLSKSNLGAEPIIISTGLNRIAL